MDVLDVLRHSGDPAVAVAPVAILQDPPVERTRGEARDLGLEVDDVPHRVGGEVYTLDPEQP